MSTLDELIRDDLSASADSVEVTDDQLGHVVHRYTRRLRAVRRQRRMRAVVAAAAAVVVLGAGAVALQQLLATVDSLPPSRTVEPTTLPVTFANLHGVWVDSASGWLLSFGSDGRLDVVNPGDPSTFDEENTTTITIGPTGITLPDHWCDLDLEPRQGGTMQSTLVREPVPWGGPTSGLCRDLTGHHTLSRLTPAVPGTEADTWSAPEPATGTQQVTSRVQIRGAWRLQASGGLLLIMWDADDANYHYALSGGGQDLTFVDGGTVSMVDDHLVFASEGPDVYCEVGSQTRLAAARVWSTDGDQPFSQALTSRTTRLACGLHSALSDVWLRVS